MKKIGFYLLMLLVSANSYAASVAVDVTSDTLEVERNSGKAVFIGNVKALYKDVTLTSKKLKIAYDEQSKSKNKIKTITAIDNVVLIQGTDKVTSKTAVYYVEDNVVIFKDNVVLNRNGNILKGEHLTMNTVTNEAKMKSAGKNRVKAIYFNKDDDKKSVK